MKAYCLEVSGDFACFTRPEMKVERVSYDVMTPSAARAIFESILWKPAIRWRVIRIDVLKPIHWISLRRNEVGAVVPINSVKGAMNRGSGELGMYVEDVRQQRAGLFLRDVAYRIHAVFELCDGSRHRSNFPYLVRQPINDPDEQRAADEANNVPKFMAMFERRARKGQCFNQPYLGCREFACDFRLVEDVQAVSAPIAESRDLGWMLHDLDFDNPADPQPRFFRAAVKSGVLAVPDWSDPEVRR
ncbi:MAG: type I-C CRISPR-associated protein Cas5 [Candidatus Accumulibacter sp.]|uniref:type I-C CRISPR-associated protein Cas5c n=1 Tax=Accumulibacter sp. TaxID=2053492 RepID=UPI0025D45375|nr:type I-C CRISPR-associated protein Cas5c [Accumulibacter sp.]MCP5249056.1 type I-C CRISPR-associated protein Cas5 [Accumulibacter sp.]